MNGFRMLFVLMLVALQTDELNEERALELAKAELEQARSIDPESIRVESLERMTWPSTALGCADAGKTYAQVPTSGYRIVLEAEGVRYGLHVGEDGAVICGKAVRAPAGKSKHKGPMKLPPTDPGLAKPVEDAKRDLADRLSIDMDRIELVELEEVVWPNPAQGCPQPGMEYRQIPVDGLRMVLIVDDRVFHYHSGGHREPFLCENPSRRPEA